MLVVFDLDGTLIDSRAGLVIASRRAYAEADIAYPGEEALLATVGLLPEAMMARLLPDRSEATRQCLADLFRVHSLTLRQEQPALEQPYPGVDQMLDTAMEAGYTLAIATGKKRQGTDHAIGSFGWQGCFASIQTAESGPGKPDPTLLYNAMADTGLGRDRAVMIGDSVFDMQMARAAGLTAIAVTWGYNPSDVLRDAGAQHIVGDVSAIAPLLDRLKLGMTAGIDL